MTFLTQIETVLFLDNMVNAIPREMVPKLFLQGFIAALVAAPVAVLVHGKMRKGRDEDPTPNDRLVMPAGQWIWKVLAIAVLYVLIYVAFGALVFRPLAGSAFEEFYSGLEMPEWILLFQAGRGLVWFLLALPVIRMMRGDWWEAEVAVALLFSVLMGGQLLIPNDILPNAIRLAHLVEVTTSNFVFGWLVVWIIGLKHSPAISAGVGSHRQ